MLEDMIEYSSQPYGQKSQQDIAGSTLNSRSAPELEQMSGEWSWLLNIDELTIMDEERRGMVIGTGGTVIESTASVTTVTALPSLVAEV